MPTRRELIVLGGVGAAAAVAGAVVGALGLQTRTGAAELLATPLPDLTGKSRTLREWQGRVLLVNFWATWCAPCLEEMPLLASLGTEMSSKGLQVVGISVDQVSKIADFARIQKIAYPLLIGDGGTISLMRKLGNTSGALPFSCILRRDGVLAHAKLGAFTRPELIRVLTPLLG